MKTYLVRFDRRWTIILVLLAPPVLVLTSLGWLLVRVPPMPDWLVGAVIAMALAAATAGSLALLAKVSVPARFVTEGGRFRIEFPQPGLLVPGDFEFGRTDVSVCKTKISRGGIHLHFEILGSPAVFQISAASRREEDLRQFLELLAGLNAVMEGHGAAAAGGDQAC